MSKINHDKDTIQRKTIEALITEGADVEVMRVLGEKPSWIMKFVEPETSANRGNAKFCFEFLNIFQMIAFLKKALSQAEQQGVYELNRRTREVGTQYEVEKNE